MEYPIELLYFVWVYLWLSILKQKLDFLKVARVIVRQQFINNVVKELATV